MPLRVIPGLEALNVLSSNPFARWPMREEGESNRLEPLCKPAFTPTFTLEHGEKVFTIGSCFARNIERVLHAYGYDVATANVEWPKSKETPVDRSNRGSELLNNFGVPSIANEFRWALDLGCPYDPNASLFEIAPGKFVDVNITRMPLMSREEALEYRAIIADVTRRVADCRVVIMTLGLSEVWFDTVSKLYLNVTPHRSLLKRYPSRFELHVLDFSETLRSLEDSITILGRFCRSDQKILLTISPVPLFLTYTDADVIVANTYSKSVLRTAAEHVAAKYDHIDYFPSFESIMLSDRTQTWMDDLRHVRDELIKMNVERMINAYRPHTEEIDERALAAKFSEARTLMEEGTPDTALRLLEPYAAIAHRNPDFALLYANLCLRQGRTEAARQVISNLPADQGRWRRDLIEATASLREGEIETATSKLVKLVAKTKKPVVFKALIEAYVEQGNWREALATARQWILLNKRAWAPFLHIARIHASQKDYEAAERAYQKAITWFRQADRDANSAGFLFEYAEFMVDRGRLEEAAQLAAFLDPESAAGRDRLDQLLAMIPSHILAAAKSSEKRLVTYESV